MIWGQAQDRELLATYQQLIEERKRNRPWDGVDFSHLLR
jgi:hypothetical protein